MMLDVNRVSTAVQLNFHESAEPCRLVIDVFKQQVPSLEAVRAVMNALKNCLHTFFVGKLGKMLVSEAKTTYRLDFVGLYITKQTMIDDITALLNKNSSVRKITAVRVPFSEVQLFHGPDGWPAGWPQTAAQTK